MAVGAKDVGVVVAGGERECVLGRACVEGAVVAVGEPEGFRKTGERTRGARGEGGGEWGSEKGVGFKEVGVAAGHDEWGARRQKNGEVVDVDGDVAESNYGSSGERYESLCEKISSIFM